jgi:hypothetical protein
MRAATVRERFPAGEQLHAVMLLVVETGFGHEEWLFNLAWLIRGFHCAYLQPVAGSFDKLTGTTQAAIDCMPG